MLHEEFEGCLKFGICGNPFGVAPTHYDMIQRGGFNDSGGGVSPSVWDMVLVQGLVGVGSLDIRGLQGINVVLGESGSGKSVLLKSLHFLSKRVSGLEGVVSSGATPLADYLEDARNPMWEFGGVRDFMQEDVSETLFGLSGNGFGCIREWVRLETGNQVTDFVFGKETGSPVKNSTYLRNGHIADYDIGVVLGHGEYDKDGMCNWLQGVFDTSMLSPKEKERYGLFLIEFKRGLFSSSPPDGVKSLVSVLHPAVKGVFGAGSVLVLDNPDAGMSPIQIEVLTLILIHLRGCGVQVFLATHSYLLLKALSLMTSNTYGVGVSYLYRGNQGEWRSTQHIGRVKNPLESSLTFLKNQHWGWS